MQRRNFVKGMAGLAAAGAISTTNASQRMAAEEGEEKNLQKITSTGRIDVHAHYIPEQYRQALVAAGHSKPSGMPAIPEWSAQKQLAVMDELGIQTSILSISAPGIHFGDDMAARRMARYCNEEGAKVGADHPGRFGLFAVLPLPDIEGALLELDYAFDKLSADGVVMETNFHGLYLGDKKLDRVFQKLNERKAKLFIHPTDPNCPCCKGNDGLQPLNYPYPMLEFMFETARAVFNLILSGTLERYPDVQVIVPHAGSVIPVLVERVAAFSAFGVGEQQDKQLHDNLRTLYFDLAGFPVPVALEALMKIADPAKLLYGSDWPFTPAPLAQKLLSALDAALAPTPRLHDAVMRGNALSLFPRLAEASRA